MPRLPRNAREINGDTSVSPHMRHEEYPPMSPHRPLTRNQLLIGAVTIAALIGFALALASILASSSEWTSQEESAISECRKQVEDRIGDLKTFQVVDVSHRGGRYAVEVAATTDDGYGRSVQHKYDCQMWTPSDDDPRWQVIDVLDLNLL